MTERPTKPPKVHKTGILVKLAPAAILCSITLNFALAQENAETLLEAQAENSGQSELLELLNYRQENPLNLNAAKSSDLVELPGIDQNLATLIVSYREEVQGYRLVEQLLEIDGMTDEIFNGIVDLVVAEQVRPVRPLLTQLSVRSRVSDEVTLNSTPQKIYNRIRFELLEKFEGGFLTEKDKGERNLDDLRLFYFQSRFARNWRAIIGNYQLEFGQGLVFWGPYGFAKSSEATFPIRKKGGGFKRYQSVNENAGLLGTAIGYEGRNVKAAVFASRNKLDATLQDDGTISTITDDGLHITELQLRRKDRLQESLAGARFSLQPTKHFQIGASGYASYFDKAIANPDFERNRYAFRGNNNHVFGLDWVYSTGEASFFGELARSKNSGGALVVGTMLKIDPIRLAFFHRNYKRDFQNLHSFGFGERNGVTQNERGYYTGIEYKISRQTRVSAYYDIFAFPWRSFSEPLPRDGNDFLVQIEHRFNTNLNITAKFREKHTQEYVLIASSSPIERQELVENKRRQLRLQLDMRVSNQVSIRSRVEHIQTGAFGYPDLPRDQKTEDGFLIYQDLRLKLLSSLQVTARFSLFDTESFVSRVFQFEHDLPGVLTNRALSGRGSKWYLLLKYISPRFGVLHVKYSETLRDDLETTPGRDKQIGLQFDFHI